MIVLQLIRLLLSIRLEMISKEPTALPSQPTRVASWLSVISSQNFSLKKSRPSNTGQLQAIMLTRRRLNSVKLASMTLTCAMTLSLLKSSQLSNPIVTAF